jgi:hypothetical protein
MAHAALPWRARTVRCVLRCFAFNLNLACSHVSRVSLSPHIDIEMYSVRYPIALFKNSWI